MIVWQLGDGLHELFNKSTETDTILMLLDAMNGLSGDIIDCTKAVAFLILPGCHDFSL